MYPCFKYFSIGFFAVFFAMCKGNANEVEWGKIPMVDWEKDFMTVADVKRDGDGKLLPLQSYDETIRRGMSFILDDHLKWFKGPLDSLVDDQGNMQMPWVHFSNLQHNGMPFPNSVDKFISYPAFHHALMIRTLLGYHGYAGDKRALAEAVKLADWISPTAHPVTGPTATFLTARSRKRSRAGSATEPD